MDSIDNTNDDRFWCPVDRAVFITLPRYIASMGITDKLSENKPVVVKKDDTAIADKGEHVHPIILNVGHNF